MAFTQNSQYINVKIDSSILVSKFRDRIPLFSSQVVYIIEIVLESEIARAWQDDPIWSNPV